MNLLEKAALILEVLSEQIELNNVECLRVSQLDKNIIYKNKELHDFCSLVYRLLHAGLCESGIHTCEHKEWKKEIEEKFRSLIGNDDVPTL